MRGMSTQPLEETQSEVPQKMLDASGAWAAVPSCQVLQEGIKGATDRNIHSVNGFLARKDMHYLVSDVPEDPSQRAALLASGSKSQSSQYYMAPLDKWVYIKDLVTRHRGELRENGGSWVRQKTPFPQDECYFHPQFNLRDKSGGLGPLPPSDNPPWEPGLVNTVLRKGPPEKEDRSYHLRCAKMDRCAKVFGLMDLFSAWGHEYTAKELYAYYLSCRIFAHKRQNQNKRGRQ